MKTTFVRTAYNYDMNKAGDEDALECKDPTKTKQSFAEECDINTIVERFAVTGQMPQNIRMPQYEDFEETFDFMSAMNALRSAQESFAAMPAKVRARFHNDPNEFVDFCGDPNNHDEAVKLGLVSLRPVPPGVDPTTGEFKLENSPKDPPKNPPKKEEK